MRLVIAAALAAALSSLSAAPVPAEPLTVLNDSLALPAPAPGQAVLVLAREEFARLRRLPADNLTLDARPLGILPQHAWLAAAVSPGRHCLSGIPDSPDLLFEAAAGETLMLRLREYVGAEDRLVSDWLFDDPGALGPLIHDRHVRHATTTATGRAKLERISRVRPGDCGRPGTLDAASLPDSALDRIRYENPLDPVNLKSDFFDTTGVLRLTEAGLRYTGHGRTVEIPFEAIRRVRFGGTRFTGTAPWVDVEYAGPGGAGTASFADARPAQAVETYDRLFRALAAGRRRAAAAPGSSGSR